MTYERQVELNAARPEKGSAKALDMFMNAWHCKGRNMKAMALKSR